jgi:hypothetical protein
MGTVVVGLTSEARRLLEEWAELRLRYELEGGSLNSVRVNYLISELGVKERAWLKAAGVRD